MELKPCPFCGGKSWLIPTSGISGRIACIGDCGIETKQFWDEPMTAPREEREKWDVLAARKWNRRANDAAD